MPLMHVVVLHSEINTMALKKTIGLIGDQHEWVKRLSREYRLLLFPAGLEPEELYRKEAIPDHSAKDILFIDCVKEGCWEADAVLIDSKSVAPQLLDRIEEVVTQKVVLVIGDRERDVNYWRCLELVRKHLPLAKVIGALQSEAETIIEGGDPEAREVAQAVLSTLGFKEFSSGDSISSEYSIAHGRQSVQRSPAHSLQKCP